MLKTKRSCLKWVVMSAVSLLVLTQSASADLMNGDFSSDLSGWVVTPASDSVIYWTHTRAALFRPDGTAANSTLSQEEITVDPEFPWLSFDVLMETDLPTETDVFTASLQHGLKLYTLYTLSSSDSVSSFAETVPRYLPSYIGPIGPDPVEVTLVFNLAHNNDDDWDTTVLLDNVALVPVPGAVVLGSIGLTFSGWLLRKRKML